MVPKTKQDPESVVKEIKRKTRRKFNSEEKIRIILEGLRGEDSIANICRKEGIAPAFTTSGARHFWRQVNGSSLRIVIVEPFGDSSVHINISISSLKTTIPEQLKRPGPEKQDQALQWQWWLMR